jgi:Protein of unknown function (DUF3551)
MRRGFKLNAAPIAALGALTFVAIAAPASAHADAYCLRDIPSYMLSCGFDTMARCQATSSGIAGDCLRDPFQSWVNGAYAYAPGYSPSQGRRGHVKATIENR